MKKLTIFTLIFVLVAASAFASLIGGGVDVGYMLEGKEVESFKSFEDIKNFNYDPDNIYADVFVNVLFLKAGAIIGESSEGYIYFDPISLEIGPVFADVGLATPFSYTDDIPEIGERTLEDFDWMKMPIIAQAATGVRLSSIELKVTGLAKLTPSIEETMLDLSSLENMAENIRTSYKVGVSVGVHF